MISLPQFWCWQLHSSCSSHWWMLTFFSYSSSAWKAEHHLKPNRRNPELGFLSGGACPYPRPSLGIRPSGQKSAAFDHYWPVVLETAYSATLFVLYRCTWLALRFLFSSVSFWTMTHFWSNFTLTSLMIFQMMQNSADSFFSTKVWHYGLIK